MTDHRRDQILHPRIRRFLRFSFCVAIPLCGAILILGACHLATKEPPEERETCVETYDRGCVTEPEFEALVEEIAGEYSAQSSFQNQWGLETIGADQAYANLQLQFGPDTAPGEGVTVGILDNPVRTVVVGGGTSYAAPMVTGGLALIKQYFRGQLSNVDLLARLLETANRTGLYSDAAIYGRGLMDLASATSPVGEPVVAMGGRVESSGAVIHVTSL